MAHELNIGTINGRTVTSILDEMVEKKIGISGGSAGGTITFDPATASVGNEFTFGGTLWIVVHKDATRLYAASKYILATMPFDTDKYDAAGTKIELASVYYAQSDLKQFARSCADMFSDAEKALLVAHPTTGDLVSAMTYNELNGGHSYFNSNSRRICYSQDSSDAQNYWTSTVHSFSSGVVWFVNTDGSFPGNDPKHSYGFRPEIVFSL